MALLSTNHKCTHPCLLLLRRESCCEEFWRWCWVLGVRNPQSIACEVWSLHFQDKLYNFDNLLIVVFTWYYYWLFTYNVYIYIYIYKTWSWHTYSYAFGFVLKTGCDINILAMVCQPAGEQRTNLMRLGRSPSATLLKSKYWIKISARSPFKPSPLA